MSTEPDVVVLIVAYQGRALLPDCLDALLADQDDSLRVEIVVVDNDSSDDTPALLLQRYPQVHVVTSPNNRGFAGGNNLGWDWIHRRFPGLKYLALVNQDLIVTPGWLGPLVAELERDDSLAGVQPKILFDSDRSRINTLGTASHFLGFGFPIACGEPDDERYQRPRRVDSLSGAASLLRVETIRQHGLFDERLFLYLEDVELGWKLRQQGFDFLAVPASRVFHQASLETNFRHYYYLERNRWWILGVYLRGSTLLLLLPALLWMELGQWWFAARQGRLRDKARATAYYLKGENLRAWRARRCAMQSARRISDRQFTARFTGRIESPRLRGWLVERVANPALQLYWAIVRRLLVG